MLDLSLTPRTTRLRTPPRHLLANHELPFPIASSHRSLPGVLVLRRSFPICPSSQIRIPHDDRTQPLVLPRGRLLLLDRCPRFSAETSGDPPPGGVSGAVWWRGMCGTDKGEGRGERHVGHVREREGDVLAGRGGSAIVYFRCSDLSTQSCICIGLRSASCTVHSAVWLPQLSCRAVPWCHIVSQMALCSASRGVALARLSLVEALVGAANDAPMTTTCRYSCKINSKAR